MNDDRRTKAQILAELELSQKTIEDLRGMIVRPPEPVPAALALAGCIRAIDAIPKVKPSSGYYGTEGGHQNVIEITNVLRHLIARYGVDVTERVTEPCSKHHLDDATDAELLERLRGFRP